jgi:hypothetical protein
MNTPTRYSRRPTQYRQSGLVAGGRMTTSQPLRTLLRYLAIFGRTVGRLCQSLIRRWTWVTTMSLFLAAVFVLWGARFALTTPIFESTHEPLHVQRVEDMGASLGGGRGEGGVTSLLTEGTCTQWGNAADDEPPLYYMLGGLLTRWIGDGEANVTLLPNPLARLYDLDAQHERNAMLHLDNPSPWSGGIVTRLYLLRLLGVLFSAGTVLLILAMARLLSTWHRADIALGAAALVALSPQFLFISATASPVAFRTLLISATGWLALRSLRSNLGPRRALAWQNALALGVLAGLAGLAGRSGWVAAGLVVATHLYLLYRNRSYPWLPRLASAGISVVAMLALAGWWWVPQWLGGGARQSFERLSGWTDVGLTGWLAEGRRALLSRWGVFGWRNVPASEPFFAAVEVLTIIGIAGLLLLLALNYWREKRITLGAGPGGVILAVWLGLAIVAVVFRGLPWWGDHFLGLVPSAWLLSAGLTAWTSNRRGWLLIGPVVIALAVTSWLAPSRFIAPSYAKPDVLALEEVPTSLADLNITFVEGPFLLGYEMIQEDVLVDGADGGELRIKLYWLARKRMRADFSASLALYGREEQVLASLDLHPGGGTYPTRLWVPGEVIVDTVRLPILSEVTAPVLGNLHIGVYLGCGQQTVYMPAMDTRGRYIGTRPRIARMRVAPTVPRVYAPASTTKIHFGDQAALIGYDLLLEPPRAGSTLHTTLYWQALAPMDRDYTVFLHLVDHEGTMVAQIDEQPQRGDYPTHVWRVGGQIRDVHVLPLPSTLAPGTYTLRVGLYCLPSGERLPITKGVSADDGEVPTFFTIDDIVIEAP